MDTDPASVARRAGSWRAHTPRVTREKKKVLKRAHQTLSLRQFLGVPHNTGYTERRDRVSGEIRLAAAEALFPVAVHEPSDEHDEGQHQGRYYHAITTDS